MREIKFRGKSVETGVWVSGLLPYKNYIREFTPKSFVDECVKNIEYAETKDYQVDENTVGQFTGLFDKTGKEIYEGDIIDFDKVEWGRCERFEEVKFDYEYLSLRQGDFRWWCEVIGNIHDNPELLKGEKEDEI